MIRLSEKSRRVLRAVYRGLGVTAISLVFQACYGPLPDNRVMYGMPPDYREEIVIHGQIKSKKTGGPVRGISIYIKDVTIDYTYSTYNEGKFSFYLPKRDNYTIIFTDVDGDENGSFKQLTINLTREDAAALNDWTIELEEVDAE